MRAALLLPLLLAGCVAAPGSGTVTGPTTSPTHATAPASSSPGATGPIVAFGDSYTEGHGARLSEAYPARLSLLIGREVANKGITGETAGEALPRLDRDALRVKPQLVIVEFGVNEAYRGCPVSRSIADIDTMTARIQNETGASVILVGVHFWGFQENFDDGLREIAARRHTGLVLDVLHGIVSSQRDRDDGDASLRSDDFHPNARGYDVMAKRIEPEVRRVLGL